MYSTAPGSPASGSATSVSRDKNREITHFHILDATFGEAHFPNTEQGIEGFNSAMKLLQKGYAYLYSSVSYVLVQKEKALMDSKVLLFASTPEKAETPDMTFKDKLKGSKKLTK